MTEPAEKVVEIGVKRERKEAAEDLLDENGVFMLAQKMLKKAWYAELILTKSRAEQDEILAKLRALEAFPETLQRFITDYKFALDRQKKHGS